MVGIENSALRNVRILRELDEDALADVANQCCWRTYRQCEMIVTYLTESTDVFFLTSGQARINIYSPQGKVVSFHDIGPGAVFGDFAAIDGGPRSANVEALESCSVATLSAERFRELLLSQPVVAMALIHRLVMEVRRLTDRVYEFSTLAVQNRIQAELLRLAKNAPCESNSTRLKPTPKQADIASRTSTHREAVSREISRLAQLGIIERRAKELWICDVNKLQQMVQQATGV